MANRFVSSTGSNTSPYDTWAKAATSLATAITGSASGDVFAIDAASPGADIAANTTWTFLGNASVIASTNSGTSTITPTTMGTSTYIGVAGATSYSLTFAGAFRVYFYGVTFRNAGSTNLAISFNTTDGGHFEFEDCYIWQGTTNASPKMRFGGSSANNNNYTKLTNTTLRFGATGQGAEFAGTFEAFGGNVSSAGSAPTTFVAAVSNAMHRLFHGVDFSHVTGTLIGSDSSAGAVTAFSQCRLGSGVTVMATQTPANKGSAKVFVFDCNSGDTHGIFQYHDAFGSVLSNTTIKFTGGAAQQSWQIATTANCSFGTPFVTPWISLYNTGTSAITPRLEILRDGSATAYTDAQVWGQFSVKDNSGFTNADFFNDRQALVDWVAGTAGANQAAGTDTWDGAGGTRWAGKVELSSAVTPAEVGHIRGRVVVGAASVSNLFVDPQIRT